jgi:hypothetical protein
MVITSGEGGHIQSRSPPVASFRCEFDPNANVPGFLGRRNRRHRPKFTKPPFLCDLLWSSNVVNGGGVSTSPPDADREPRVVLGGEDDLILSCFDTRQSAALAPA